MLSFLLVPLALGGCFLLGTRPADNEKVTETDSGRNHDAAASEYWKPTLLTDFSDDLPESDDPSRISFRLQGIRPMPSGEVGDVYVELIYRDGQWAADGQRASADYNQRSSNEVEIGDLAFDGKTLKGSLTVTIHADRPRPNPKQGVGPFPFPSTLDWDPQARNYKPDPDVFKITIDAKRKAGQPMPFIADRVTGQPPWRKDTPTFGGDWIDGSYTAQRDDVTTTGKVTGAVAPISSDVQFGTWGNINIKPAEDGKGGVDVLARLPRERVSDRYGSSFSKSLTEPQDWTSYAGVRITLDSETRRNEVGITFTAQQKGRTWHHLNDAAFPIGREHVFYVPFDQLGPEGKDRDAITRFGIDVSNPMGVGDVTFTIRKIELIRDTNPLLARQAPALPSVVVHPDTIISLNDADMIPKGLFGHHDVGESNPRQGDRDVSPTDYMRDINPGFLRPLSHVGFGPNAQGLPGKTFIERARAAKALDNFVWCHTVDLFARPDWMDQGADVWEKKVGLFYRDLASKMWTPENPGSDEQPGRYLRKLEVWNEPFFWGRHINIGPQTPAGKKKYTDPTQHGYMPGKLGAEVYARFYNAAAENAKAVNPHVMMGAISNASFNGDHWGNLFNYAGRIIDQTADNIDFLTEHHYGGHPESYAASYEVVTAYMDLKHNKRVPIYNTESNNLGASDAAKAEYNIRDILECIRRSPDKVKGRALHALWWGYLRDKGEYDLYHILRDVRGKLVKVETNREDLIAVASTPEQGKLVLFVFNRLGEDADMHMLGLDGFELTAARTMIADPPKYRVDYGDLEGQAAEEAAKERTRIEQAKVNFDGAHATYRLPRRSALVMTFTKKDYEPAKVEAGQQDFINILNQTIEPGATIKVKPRWHRIDPSRKYDKLLLRMITRGVGEGEGEVKIAGRTYKLPVSSPAPGGEVVQEVEISPDFLNKNMTLEFSATDADQNGYTVMSASLIAVESRKTQAE